MKEHELISKVHAYLQERTRAAGQRYEVLAPGFTAWSKSNMGVLPDLVVHDKMKNCYLVFELKHYEHQRPLSLSTVPLARLLKAETKPYPVQVAVVTNSSMISDSLKSGLASEEIPIIEYSNDDQVAENVWNFIRAQAG